MIIAIDNGVTGSVGIIKGNGEPVHFAMPVFEEYNYTKVKAKLHRIDTKLLKIRIIQEIASSQRFNILCVIERPMINPMRWKASVSAIRALEATQIVLEELCIPYRWIDSREWQKALLPSGLKGDELKKASLDIGRRFFPHIQFKKDADAMLIAKYAQMKWGGKP